VDYLSISPIFADNLVEQKPGTAPTIEIFAFCGRRRANLFAKGNKPWFGFRPTQPTSSTRTWAAYFNLSRWFLAFP
jgi:hypothetical protein